MTMDEAMIHVTQTFGNALAEKLQFVEGTNPASEPIFSIWLQMETLVSSRLSWDDAVREVESLTARDLQDLVDASLAEQVRVQQMVATLAGRL